MQKNWIFYQNNISAVLLFKVSAGLFHQAVCKIGLKRCTEENGYLPVNGRKGWREGCHISSVVGRVGPVSPGVLRHWFSAKPEPVF
jgi:hypothetical protein